MLTYKLREFFRQRAEKGDPIAAVFYERIQLVPDSLLDDYVIEMFRLIFESYDQMYKQFAQFAKYGPTTTTIHIDGAEVMRQTREENARYRAALQSIHDQRFTTAMDIAFQALHPAERRQ